MAPQWCVLLWCTAAVAAAGAGRQTAQDIQRVEEYIANASRYMNPRYRQHYHLSPPVGWMNDPNGFSYYKGEYHLFYQFYPYDSVWGPMYWGHSTSKDLVNWKTLPTALVPDEEMCFSGSAIAVEDKLVLIYTGRRTTGVQPFYNETQYLATSDDGINFTKYAGNPVLSSAPNMSPDFRDPKVWRHGDYWYVVIGSKTDDMKRGRALLYRSTDMLSWDYLTTLGETGVTGDYGYMWECPDFFELDGKYILLWSPQGMQPQGDRYKNIYQTGFILGDFSYENFLFENLTSFQEIDYGHDFYASQTVENDGKRYLVAWLNTWEKIHPEAADGWVGTMSIIRELSIVGDRVLMKPVEAITVLREDVVMNGSLATENVIEFGQTGEIVIEGLNLAQSIILSLRGRNGGDQVYITWDPAVGKVAVIRNGDVRQVEWSPIDGRNWRLFLDASSLELFCGEGEVVFSSRAYPDGDWILENRSASALKVIAYKLRKSVPDMPSLSSTSRVLSSMLLLTIVSDLALY